nr:hypothetical protein L203_06631 [Cryptococcus depauperatus CBS 7841]
MVYWIFGYGSLIFKPPPHTVEQQPGYVKGVVRRFAQSSNDHRGTPESPGRVVTVVESRDWHELEGIQLNEGEVLQEDCVWGIAYRIDSEKEDEVRSYMEYREKVPNGYTRHEIPVYTHTTDKKQEQVVVEKAEIWIGKLSDPAFVGYEPMEDVARIIAEREGPSGKNSDYLYKLAKSIRELYPNVMDDYLFKLETLVRGLDLNGN